MVINLRGKIRLLKRQKWQVEENEGKIKYIVYILCLIQRAFNGVQRKIQREKQLKH